MRDVGNGTYAFGEFRVDPGKRRILDGTGAPVPLTSKVFDTLVYLLNNRGRIIDKEELMSAIWTDTIVEENNLSQNISALRRLLGEQRGDHRFIVTVPGKGFKFVADVQELSENGERIAYSDTGRPLSDVSPRDPVTVISTPKTTRLAMAIASFAIFVVVAGSSYLVSLYFRDGSSSDGPITSVAVLPFFNAGGDRDAEYLSDGISESLIDRLSEFSELKVIARNSSFKYRSEDTNLQEAGDSLGARAIVSGRVFRRGDDLSIRVELVDTVNNRQLWSGKYDRKAADAAVVDREIAQAISEKLGLKSPLSRMYESRRQTAVDPKAYEQMLKGRYQSAKGGVENSKKSTVYFQRAVELDPNYALAYALLSDSYFYSLSVLDPDGLTPKAAAAAEKAIELDENLADGHRARANLYLNDWNWKAAEAEYKRAIDLKRNEAKTLNNYSAYLSVMARHDEALAMAEHTRDLDPLTASNYVTLGFVLYGARRFPEAIAEYEKVIKTDPDYLSAYPFLGSAFLANGQYKEAIGTFQKLISHEPENSSSQIFLGAAYARSGNRYKAQTILSQLESSKAYVSSGELALLYASLGDREKAFASLEKAYAEHDLQLQWLAFEPLYDSLRSDSRFRDLLMRLGLPG